MKTEKEHIAFVYIGSKGNSGAYTKQFVDKICVYNKVELFVHNDYIFNHEKNVYSHKIAFPFSDKYFNNSWFKKPIKYLELLFFYVFTLLTIKKRNVKILIYNPVSNLLVDVIFIRLCKTLKIYVVSVVHDAISHYNKPENYRDFIFSISNHLIFHNKHSYDILIDRLNLNMDTSFINFPWYSSSFNMQESSKEKYFLFIGHDRPSKGLDLLIDAYTNLETDFKLIIAGDISKKNLDKIYKLNSNNIILLNCYISDFDFISLMQKSSYLILPYSEYYSNSSIHYNAYLYTKTPVICSDIPLFDILEDGLHCFKFKCGSKFSLEKVLLKSAQLSFAEYEAICESGYSFMKTLQEDLNFQIIELIRKLNIKK